MPQVVLDFDTDEAVRIQNALTYMLQLDSPGAGVQDYKDFLIAKTIQFVKTAERRQAEEAIANQTDVVIT